jgi:transposase
MLMSMKQDGRKLDHRTLEEMLIRAVLQVQSGVSPEDVTKALGSSSPVIYNRLPAYKTQKTERLSAKKSLK